MKKITISLIMLLSMQYFAAKGNDAEKMSISMVSCTDAKFTHDSTYSQCAAKYVLSASLSVDTIYIYENDTEIIQTDCICPFNLSMTLSNLTADKYKVKVFRSAGLMVPDYYLIGELDLNTSLANFGSTQECHDTSALIGPLYGLTLVGNILQAWVVGLNGTSCIEWKAKPVNDTLVISLLRDEACTECYLSAKTYYNISGCNLKIIKFNNEIIDLSLPPDIPIEHSAKNSDDEFSYSYTVKNLCNEETSLPAIPSNNNFTIWPVPAGDQLHITNNDNMKSLSVYNTIGVKALDPKSSDGIIDISGLSSGVFFLLITDNTGKKQMLKFIKE